MVKPYSKISKCEKCDLIATKQSNTSRHVKEKHLTIKAVKTKKEYNCNVSKKVFATKYKLSRHEDTHKFEGYVWHCSYKFFIYLIHDLTKIPQKNNYICPLCNKILKRKDRCIQCDLCEEWIHLFKCSLLTTDDFEFLSHTENKWHCSKCTLETLPFHDINDNDLFIVNLGIDCNSYRNLSFISRSSNDFITDCQNLLNNPSDKILNEQEDEF